MPRIHVPVALRWSDLDAYGHVNNAAMLTLLEGESATTVTLVARQEVEYLAPIPYLREPLDVQLWIGRLGGASLDVCYEVCSPLGAEPGTVYAKASTTIVLVDAATGRPRRLTDREREAWAPHVEESVAFTKRS